jgi:hypothetical protein
VYSPEVSQEKASLRSMTGNHSRSTQHRPCARGTTAAQQPLIHPFFAESAAPALPAPVLTHGQESARSAPRQRLGSLDSAKNGIAIVFVLRTCFLSNVKNPKEAGSHNHSLSRRRRAIGHLLSWGIGCLTGSPGEYPHRRTLERRGMCRWLSREFSDGGTLPK